MPIVFEDEDLLILSKPCGLDLGQLEEVEGDGLVERLDVLLGREVRAWSVNRLSRYEAGLVILCQNRAALRFLREKLRHGGIIQTYTVGARGRARFRRFTIEGGRVARPLGNSEKGGRAPKRGRNAGGSEAAAGRTATGLEPKNKRADAVHVKVEAEKDGALILSCETALRSPHAFKAALRAADLRVVGDTRGGPKGQAAGRPFLTAMGLARLAFTHPKTRKPFTTSLPPNRFQWPLDELAKGGFPIEMVLQTAVARRLPLIAEEATDGMRWLTGDVEGLPRLNIEQFGSVALLCLLGPSKAYPRVLLTQIGKFMQHLPGITSVYAKTMAPRRDTSTAVEDAFRHILGPRVEGIVPVREGDLIFETEPTLGLSPGLFPDHRDNRQRIRAAAEGLRVLNLFAYTCAFSAAAAKGGASSVTSVDQSRQSLEKGRRNFERNGLDPAAHRFVHEDVFKYIERAARREERFNLVILDPPTFSRSKRPQRIFEIQKHLGGLLRLVQGVLAEEALVMVATNCRRFTRFEEIVRRPGGGLKGVIVEKPPLPLDYADDPDHARTLFVRYEA